MYILGFVKKVESIFYIKELCDMIIQFLYFVQLNFYL